MSFNAQGGGLKQRPIAPVGAHVAICFSIIDLGTHLKSYQGKEPKRTPLIHFSWEFPNLPHAVFKEGESPKPLGIFQEYTTSLDDRSKLFQALSSWRGIAPKDLNKELPAFLGQSCLINVVHAPNKTAPDIIYSNIANGGTGIMRVPQGMPINPRTNPTIIFNLDNYSHQEFLKLPEWIQKKIRTSLEWSGIVAKFGEPPVVNTQNNQAQPIQNNTQFQGQNQGFNNQPQNFNQNTNQPVNTAFNQPVNNQPVQNNQLANPIHTGANTNDPPPF